MSFCCQSRFASGWLALGLLFLGSCAVPAPCRAQILPTNKWTAPISRSDACPAIGYDGTIYVSGFSQTLSAVSSNGVIKWVFETGSEVLSSPALAADGTIYFGCRDRKFYALNPTGKQLWEFKTG